MQVNLFPFVSGVNQQIDIRLLPDGALADAINVELDRDGRLIGRAKYTAQATTVYQAGTFVAYDLFSLNDRLFAFGDAHGYGFPSDIYEYEPDNLAARWRPTAPFNDQTPRLPRATQVRDIARPPDQEGGVTSMDCAAFGGFAAMAWEGPSTALAFAHVVSAAKNQTLAYEGSNSGTLPNRLIRVVAMSDRFLFLGVVQVTLDAVMLSRFIPASDENFVLVSSSIQNLGAVVTWAVCKVAGADQFCIITATSTTVTVRRFDNVGTLQVPSGGQYAAITVAATAVAVEASSTANQLVIAMVVGGETRLFGYNLSTGAELGTGPHVPFSGETATDCGLCRVSSTVIQVASSVTSETEPTVMTRRFTVASATFPSALVRAVSDGQLTSSPIFATETFFGIRCGTGTVGNTPNLLISSGTGANEVTPQIAKDLELAHTTSTLLPSLAFDSSTNKYYWVNAQAKPDGAANPLLTEFSLTDTRRRVCSLGNLAYIGGGVPLVFDGVSVVESGFLCRPRIISLTPSNSTGELLSGATYDYRHHWEWVDTDGNLHLSPPSKITSVTLGASDDTVTAVVTSPISMRRTRGIVAGGVQCVLSRTLATVSRTAATLTGNAVLDPPSSSLTGLTLFIFVVDETSAQLFTVTFDAGSITTDAIVTDVNAITTGRVTASNAGGSLRLTLDDAGEGNDMWIYGGTAATILGFSVNQNDAGTTTFTKGENFQRAAVAFTASVAGQVADYVTVTDVKKDQSDPIVDTDLIRQQVLYSSGIAAGAHHSPGPGDSVAAGRERIVVARQPRRGRLSFSKLLVPVEPAEFAFEGFRNFQGQVAGDIEDIAVLGDSVIAWTRREIWEVSGSGPGRNGVGEFFAAQRLSRGVGLIADGGRSIVLDDIGAWFQGNDAEIYRLSRAGQLDWMSREVQDYLDTYPVVTAATIVPGTQEVAFAVTNSAGSTGGILRYNASAKSWFFDDVGVVTSMADFAGRIAYVQGGVVYIQDSAPGSGTFVPYSVKGNMFQGFDVMGYGQVHRVGIYGTWQGECTVELFFSEDGVDFTQSLGSWALSTAEYDPGDPVRLLVQPPDDSQPSFALRAAVTYAGTDSAGVWLHAFATETEKRPNLVRLGPTHTL